MTSIADRLDENETDPTDTPTIPRRGGGPRTAEGKEKSRRNALKHGLCAKVLLPDEMAAAVAQRTEEFADEWEPASPYEDWLVGEIALATTRLDRCAAMALADLRRVMQRASLIWDKDRRMLAEDLGVRLGKEPTRVSRALQRSRQGCDWLIERWEGLARALEAGGAWDEDQRRLAFDLLGVPHTVRDDRGKVPPAKDLAGLARLAASEIARLRRDQELSLIELDEAERAMSASGMPMSEDRETARLRKYEASCRRALLLAHSEFKRIRKSSRPARSSDPRPKLSKPAADYLADRTDAAIRERLERTLGRAPDPAAMPFSEPGHRPGLVRPLGRASASLSQAGPRNRHERRAAERINRPAPGHPSAR
jgi:hypothetical protein